MPLLCTTLPTRSLALTVAGEASAGALGVRHPTLPTLRHACARQPETRALTDELTAPPPKEYQTQSVLRCALLPEIQPAQVS